VIFHGPIGVDAMCSSTLSFRVFARVRAHDYYFGRVRAHIMASLYGCYVILHGLIGVDAM
jgi:hypothetical protein